MKIKLLLSILVFSSLSALYAQNCSPFTVPFQEGFNSNSTTESCWTVLNLNNDTDEWLLNNTINPFDGNECAMLFTNGNGTGDNSNNDWLISPQINLNGNQILKFRYRVHNAADPNNFRVMLSTNGIDPVNFTTTLVPLTTYTNLEYLEAVIPLTDIAGIVNIGFHVPPGGPDGSRLYIDRVVIENVNSCTELTNLIINNIESNSATFSWTENNTISPSQWEIIVLPNNLPEPSPNLPIGTGTIATNNNITISNLIPTTQYSTYIRAICSETDISIWSMVRNFTTPPINDNCINAIFVPVSNGASCYQMASGTILYATPSQVPFPPGCIGTPNDDVWFKFIATSNYLQISLKDIIGSTNNLNHAVYSGDCNELNRISCSTSTQTSSITSHLTIGQTYFIRVYSNATEPHTTNFNICILIPPTCSNSNNICNGYTYSNATGISSLGQIGCLTSTPNASFFNLKVTQSGPINFLLTQRTNLNGSPNLDVDYAAWGPFTSQSAACNAIHLPGGGFLAPGIGVPVTPQTGCSYSSNSTETLNIVNAQAGQYYIIMITNYSNQYGYIDITQTNIGQLGAGSVDCDSPIQLNAFLDINNNGTKEANELNFPLGQFHYEINNDGNIHNIISPTGNHTLFDYNQSNNYTLTYSINSDYSSLYNSNTSYSNVTINSGITTYNFPISIVQNHEDIDVSIIPTNSPRAGFSYQNSISIKNNGNQTIPTGTISFTKDNNLTISSTTPTVSSTQNGFNFSFTNLNPFEERIVTVNFQVPNIPTIAIGQLITNSVELITPSSDFVTHNNNSSVTQAVIAAYDPNDKTEAHGEKINFTTFNEQDYLNYTIRFENTGNTGASKVVVKDILDEKLEESSLIMISSSHNYFLDRVEKNLEWTFDDIFLPVSIPNSDIGKGYINFKIKPKTGFAVGDIIPNTAEIYFDFNPAIITNTFNTEFVETLGNATFNKNSIQLYPNPAKESFTIHNYGTETINDICIYEISGKRIFQQRKSFENQTTIPISNFAKGIYTVEIISDNKYKITKKLVIK
jgi:uncharacterized repeat protein (TIGR01451 family)